MGGVTIGAAVIAGGAMIYSANKSADAASAAAKSGQDAASASAAAQLSFDTERYENQMQDIADLEAIFGPVRENLNQYYKDMSVEQIQLRGRENIEKQYERSNKNIDATFSNNGMYSSGQRASAQVALESAREETLGRNKLNAETQFEQEQLKWLGTGLQEKNSVRGLAANTAGMISQGYANQGNIAMQGGLTQSNIEMQRAQSYGEVANGMFSLAGYSALGGFGGNSTYSTGTYSGGNYVAPSSGLNSLSNTQNQVRLANAGL